MTDQNQNTQGWGDPNARPNVEGGNQSGGQQPSGQPGEYTHPDQGHTDGQFGQPGEYAAPAAHSNEGHYGQPGEYAHPVQDSSTGQGGQYPSDPYPSGPYQQGQNQTGGYQQGQYPTGGFPAGAHQNRPGEPGRTDQFGQPGQYGQNGQNESGPYAPYAGSAPGGQQGHDGFGAPQQATRKPKTDENGEPYGVGPFTLRETIVAGLGFLLLVASFLPLVGGQYAAYVGYSNLWGPAPWLVIPGALVFVAAAALIVLRRTVPSVGWKVGSLSVDQFASAAAISTAGFHLGAILLMLGLGVWFGGSTDGFAPGAGPVLGLIVSLAAIALTTFGHRIPPFASDFRDRAASEAHPFARVPKNVPQRPKPEPQQAAAGNGGQGAAPAGWPAGAQAPSASGHQTGQAPSWQQPSSEPWPGTPEAAQTPPPTAVFSSPDGHGGEPQSDPRTVFDANAPHIDGGQDTSQQEAPPTAVFDTSEPEEPVAIADHTHSAQQPQVEFAPAEPSPIEPAPSEDHTAEDPTIATNEPESHHTPVEQPVAQPVAFAPYWVLAPEPRPVADMSTGATLFEVGPTAWALAVGEHDGGLVIRADDGRVGVLRSIDDLTRG